MVTRFIRNYNKEDCINFKWVQFSGCCGRSGKRGVCNLTQDSQMCIQSAPYCIYQRKGERELEKD